MAVILEKAPSSLGTTYMRVGYKWGEKTQHTKRKDDFLSDKVRPSGTHVSYKYIILISHVRHTKSRHDILGSKTKERMLWMLWCREQHQGLLLFFPQVFWVVLLLIATHISYMCAHIPCTPWCWVMEFGHWYHRVFYLQNIFENLINSLIVETLI